MTEARGFPAFGPVSGHGRFAGSWWGRSWIKALEDTALDEAQLRRGRAYARTGYVGPISVSAGRIDATVQDYEADTAYRSVVRLEPLSDSEWRRFLDQVAAKSGHIAALLDRDMPRELVDAAQDAGVRLLPEIGDLDPECDCPGWELPCRHAAALAYQVSWLLDADPFVLLLVRGRDETTLLGELRVRDRPAVPAGVAVAQAFAAPVGPLPEPAEPIAALPLAVPAAPGIDPAALALLAGNAAARAHAVLTTGDPPDPAKWPDSVRLAAAFPEHRLPRSPELDRAVLAWRFGGRSGLDVLETAWTPPKAELARAVSELVAALDDGQPPEVWRNRLTSADGQLRYGRDGRWHPYREVAGDWEPAGPPHQDPVAALAEL